MPSPEPALPKKYTHAPVVERALHLFADIPEDVYQENLNRWAEIVRIEFPHYTRHVEWKVAVASQGDLPFIQADNSSMSLRHRYWSCNPAQGHADWCLQLLRNSLIVNLRQKHGDSTDKRGFHDLFETFEIWRPRWMEIFRVTKIARIRLEYWNNLNHTTIPGLATEKLIQAGDVLTVFANTPRPKGVTCYTPPYECIHSWLAQIDDSAYTLRAETKSLDIMPTTLQVHFSAECSVEDIDALRKAVNIEHNLISDTFDVFFTDKAKKIFGVET